MKRETAIEKANRAFLAAEWDDKETENIISSFADSLQRECDQREGLIEMAKVLLSSIVGFQNQYEPWKKGLERWKAEYEKLKNV